MNARVLNKGSRRNTTAVDVVYILLALVAALLLLALEMLEKMVSGSFSRRSRNNTLQL